MFGIGTIKIALIAACLIAVAVTVVALKRWWEGPKPPVVDRLGPYTVVECPSGASVAYSVGRRERKRITAQLAGIAAPAPSERLYGESKAALASAAGSQIWIEVEGKRRKATQLAVFGESGQELQVSQLAAGLAWLTDDAPPDDWKAAQAEAKKAKRGVWANTTCPQCEGSGMLMPEGKP